MAKKSKARKFIDHNGNSHDTQLGDLKVGSKFILYGTELCTVISLDPEIGPASVVYKWGDRKPHQGLPAIRTWDAWCEEKT
jgi:hypothetical protein